VSSAILDDLDRLAVFMQFQKKQN